MTVVAAPGTGGAIVRPTRTWGVVLAFLRRDWSIALSYRLPFFLGLGQSLVTVAFLYFLGRLVGSRIATVAGGLHVSYFSYVVLGTALLAIFSVSLTSFALRLRTDQTTGTLEVLFTMPPRASVIVLASASYEITYALVVAMVTVALAAGFGLSFDASALGAVAAAVGLVATLALFCAAGVMFAAFVVVFKRGETITSVAAGLLSVLGGVYYPVALMPGPLRAIADVLPFTWALDALRDTLLAHEVPYARIGELWLSAVVLLPLSLWLFAASLRRARRQGSLGQY